MNHWAENYIGHQWSSSGNGPDVWNCWTFFRHIQHSVYCIDVPEIGIDASSAISCAHEFNNNVERESWRSVDEPADGDAVLLAHSKYPLHVGIWLDIDGGGILHCQRASGVVFTKRNALQPTGWKVYGFYRYAGGML